MCIGLVALLRYIHKQHIHAENRPARATSELASLPFPPPCFYNNGRVINHSYGNAPEFLMGVCSLDVNILTRLPSNHTSSLQCSQLTWPLVWNRDSDCRIQYQAAQKDKSPTLNVAVSGQLGMDGEESILKSAKTIMSLFSLSLLLPCLNRQHSPHHPPFPQGIQ